MRLPLYIAWRYLFAKKSHNAINIISGISMLGVLLGTMAMILALSVFNGFDDLFKSLMSNLDADIKVSPAVGKTFDASNTKIISLAEIEGVDATSEILEENALFKYRDKQAIATVKGVSGSYVSTNGIDSLIVDGQFLLYDEHNKPMAIMGRGIQYILDARLNFVNPIHVYVPKRSGKLTTNPERAFKKDYLFPSGVFKVQMDYDNEYIIMPIDFVRNLLEYKNDVSFINIKVKEGYKMEKVQKQIQKHLGEEYIVQNRFQQNESLYKIFETEKLATFVIFTFILIIFSFNLIGTLTMLIIEKKNNITTLKNMGADNSMIHKIFLYEGWLISILGAVGGLILGLILSLIQIKFGVIQLQGGSYIVDAYPMGLELKDFVITFFTVAVLGWVSAFIPIRFMIKRKVFEVK